jgi:hypothetical protein
MPGRTDNSVKNRFHALERARKHKKVDSFFLEDLEYCRSMIQQILNVDIDQLFSMAPPPKPIKSASNRQHRGGVGESDSEMDEEGTHTGGEDRDDVASSSNGTVPLERDGRRPENSPIFSFNVNSTDSYDTIASDKSLMNLYSIGEILSLDNVDLSRSERELVPETRDEILELEEGMRQQGVGGSNGIAHLDYYASLLRTMSRPQMNDLRSDETPKSQQQPCHPQPRPHYQQQHRHQQMEIENELTDGTKKRRIDYSFPTSTSTSTSTNMTTSSFSPSSLSSTSHHTRDESFGSNNPEQIAVILLQMSK